VTIKTINDLKPDPNNANRGTERGHRIVNNSIQRHGAGRSGLAARDGTMIAGSQTLEEMAALGMKIKPVHTTGDEWVVVIRDDVEPGSEQATLMGLEDNRGAQEGIEWDPGILAELAQQFDVSGLFTGDELAEWAQPSEPEAGAGGDEEEIDDPESEIDDLLAPFPWFGGKARVAARVWARFGEVENYVEPFCGSAAVLLACPYDIPTRTVNDADGFISNFWRAVEADSEGVARFADWPVNESDLFSRHVWLIRQSGELARRLETDPDYYDAKIAGWWLWGCCAWIGTGWCSGEGPWNVDGDRVVNVRGNAGRGVNRKLPHLGNAGRGVNRKLPHLGDAGRGVNRQLPHLGDAGQGECAVWSEHIRDYMQRLSDKLRRVRVCCGDWARVVTPSVTTRHGLTAVLLDPPYGEGAQEYSAGGNADKGIAADVWAWAVANGDDPQMRIAVCGYDDGRTVPLGWSVMRWTARKGYQATEAATANPSREVVWFSPHCVKLDNAVSTE
jgi:hypothetical protein